MCKHEWNTHLYMLLAVHYIIDHVLCGPRREEDWDKCLHLRIWIVEYRGSENVTPAEEGNLDPQEGRRMEGFVPK